MATEYGEGGSVTVTMDGPFAGAGTMVTKITEISAPAANWKGGESPYSQVVAVDGVSVNSKVDIQLSVDQMERFHDQDIAFTTENDGGTVTLYAIGDKPESDCVFQATITEVIA